MPYCNTGVGDFLLLVCQPQFRRGVLEHGCALPFHGLQSNLSGMSHTVLGISGLWTSAVKLGAWDIGCNSIMGNRNE